MTAFRRRTILTFLAASGVAACTDELKQPFPEKHFFLIDCPRPDRLPPPANGLVLTTRPFQVSPGLHDRGLVLRTDKQSWRTDFYNAFFVPPGAMMESVTEQWLAHAGLFSVVETGASRLAATHALEGGLTGLYGDLSSGEPKAVIELELLLLDIRSSASIIVARGEYRQAQHVASGDSDVLVAGWNEGLALILSTFEAAVKTGLAATRS
jgi:hypothetical protein